MGSADLQRNLVSWSGKLVFSLTGAASVFFLAKLALPLSRDLLFSLLPQLLDPIRGYLSPPYLFVFVNFMIFLILKLSDEKKSTPRHQPDYVKAPSEASQAPPPAKEVVMEGAAAVAAAPPPPTSKSVDAAATAAAVEDDHASMDETWMTIMQKRMATNERQIVEEKHVQWDDEHDDVHEDEHDHGHDEDEDHDEMNRQFEAFIKKVNEQIRLQSERSSLPSKEIAVKN